MSACSLTLFLHPPPPPPPASSLIPKPYLYSLSPFSHSSKPFRPSYICFSSNSSTSPNDREESRWLREEQRWLREEQRWLREEQRWARDRDSLLREIAELKLKIQALERQGGGTGVVSESETIANIAGLLQVLKEKNQIAETGSSSRALDLDHEEVQEIKEVVAVSEVKVEEETKKKTKRRNALRKGSEGKEVQAMQEALQKLGFYSGEEDMEFSSFSSGTERAVKTWQASLDLPQDGILTVELLERLYMDPQVDDKWSSPIVTPKEDANGAAVTSVTEISEVQKAVVKEEGAAEVEVSRHRVFLLGENRWEDSSRLSSSKKNGGETKTTRCLTCRGEGRLLCQECDGTGDLNIEEQFLDWVEEGAKCPYCEGLGYTICDVCEGKPVG